jgi:hypothetical protein
MKCWSVDLGLNIPCFVFHNQRGKATWIAIMAAKEAGFKVDFKYVRVKRHRDYDYHFTPKLEGIALSAESILKR